MGVAKTMFCIARASDEIVCSWYRFPMTLNLLTLGAMSVAGPFLSALMPIQSSFGTAPDLAVILTPGTSGSSYVTPSRGVIDL